MRCPFLTLLFLCIAAAVHAETAPKLSLPLACTPGKDCFIQQYVDVEPAAGTKDYTCGIATYDGHSGTDFRILSVKAAEAGVPVLASAAGRIKAVRDGMADRLVISAEERASVKDRECGNGVVIDHGAGWETQYCHMRRGSVMVHEGQTVATGTPLGLVGFSGSAQFPHVHLSVRLDGKTVDPFLGQPVSGVCQRGDALPPSNLWAPNVGEQLVYRDALIIEARFAAAPVTPREAEQGDIAPPGPDSPALIFFARLINVRAGDRVSLSAEGPGGFEAAHEGEPLQSSKAQYVGFAGKKRRDAHWASGIYQGAVTVIRDGKVIGEAKSTLRLP